MKTFKKSICITLMVALLISMFSVSAFAISKPGKVTDLKISATTTSSITLSWKKVKGAKGYEIYRSTSKDGTYKCIKTIKSGSTVTYKNRELRNNKKYWYKVRAYKLDSNNKKVRGSFSYKKSGTTLAIPKPAKVDNVIVKTRSTSSITLAWDAVKGVEGYDIYRATSKDGTYRYLGSTESFERTYKDTGLKADKTYWYKVRGYKIDAAEYYVNGTFSNKISATTKSLHNIVLPIFPITLSENWSSGELIYSARIDDATLTYEDDADGTYNAIIKVKGTFLGGESIYCSPEIQIFDANGYMIDTEYIFVSSHLSAGQKFIEDSTIYGLKKGKKYTIKIVR